MRPTMLRLATRPIPLSAIPPTALRLPPKPASTPNLSASSTHSPTIDRLLKSFASPPSRAPSRTGLPHDGRGLANAAVHAEALAEQPGATPEATQLPPNLRIEQYVPKRREFEGVSASHRDLLRRLRREA
ncbi:hypothetical protein JCM21900_003231 [Sporobolomyces salmonicolor]